MKNRVVLCACTAAAALFACSAAPVVAATSYGAGADVLNTAEVRFNQNGQDLQVGSNTVATRLDERLDVTVSAAAQLATTSGATGPALAFRVINAGNGQEAFDLSATTVAGGAFTPTIKQIAVDANGDGQLSLSTDTAFGGAAETPVLTPGQSVTVFILSDIPTTAMGAASVRLTAAAKTGHGQPGEVFVGRGDGGSDAIVGKTGALASADGAYVINVAPVQLIKSQVVTDADGGTRAMAGSIITYTLDAKFLGAGAFTGARLADATPVGSSFISGSVKLDGAPLSDAAATDSAGLSVALGDVTGPAEHVLTFQVRINSNGSNP